MKYISNFIRKNIVGETKSDKSFEVYSEKYELIKGDFAGAYQSTMKSASASYEFSSKCAESAKYVYDYCPSVAVGAALSFAAAFIAPAGIAGMMAAPGATFIAANMITNFNYVYESCSEGTKALVHFVQANCEALALVGAVTAYLIDLVDNGVKDSMKYGSEGIDYSLKCMQYAQELVNTDLLKMTGIESFVSAYAQF